MSNSDTTVIVGRKPVREALERRPSEIEKLLLQQGLEGGDISQIRTLASRAGIPIQYVPAGRLSSLARGATHQGVALMAAAVAYRDLGELLGEIGETFEEVKERQPLLLVLDRIQDPYNFGALLRTAVAAGVSGVIVPTTHMAPVSPTVMKASAGTASRIPIARTDDLPGTLYALKERGYWILGAAGKTQQTLWETDWGRPIALVMGSEGEGLRNDVAAECDEFVSIPMPGPVESLNVSVAGGIVLFAALQGRLTSDQT